MIQLNTSRTLLDSSGERGPHCSGCYMWQRRVELCWSPASTQQNPSHSLCSQSKSIQGDVQDPTPCTITRDPGAESFPNGPKVSKCESQSQEPKASFEFPAGAFGAHTSPWAIFLCYCHAGNKEVEWKWNHTGHESEVSPTGTQCALPTPAMFCFLICMLVAYMLSDL